MAGDWTSKCGGVRWRTLPDERVEIEGAGVPSYAPGSQGMIPLAKTWANWAPLFKASAAKYKVPASWLVALVTQETGYLAGNPAKQASVTSTDGYGSIGLMQPLVSFAKMLGYSPEDRYDPAKNIDMGAIYAAQNVAKYGRELPFIAASHNAGSPRCKSGGNRWNMVMTGDYVGNVVRFNNAAIELLKANQGTFSLGSSTGLFVAGGLLLGGAAWVAFDPKLRGKIVNWF